MLQGIGAPEILIILLILVLLFGAKKLPELARGAGQSLKIFKDEVKPDGTDGPGALEASTDTVAEKKPEQQG
jgi:sec-independent protein translocase protein TatA